MHYFSNWIVRLKDYVVHCFFFFFLLFTTLWYYNYTCHYLLFFTWHYAHTGRYYTGIVYYSQSRSSNNRFTTINYNNVSLDIVFWTIYKRFRFSWVTQTSRKQQNFTKSMYEFDSYLTANVLKVTTFYKIGVRVKNIITRVFFWHDCQRIILKIFLLYSQTTTRRCVQR